MKHETCRNLTGTANSNGTLLWHIKHFVDEKPITVSNQSPRFKFTTVVFPVVANSGRDFFSGRRRVLAVQPPGGLGTTVMRGHAGSGDFRAGVAHESEPTRALVAFHDAAVVEVHRLVGAAEHVVIVTRVCGARLPAPWRSKTLFHHENSIAHFVVCPLWPGLWAGVKLDITSWFSTVNRFILMRTDTAEIRFFFGRAVTTIWSQRLLHTTTDSRQFW